METNNLNHDELVRLECLSRAIAYDSQTSTETLVSIASKFEDYVKNGKNGSQTNG